VLVRSRKEEHLNLKELSPASDPGEIRIGWFKEKSRKETRVLEGGRSTGRGERGGTEKQLLWVKKPGEEKKHKRKGEGRVIICKCDRG